MDLATSGCCQLMLPVRPPFRLENSRSFAKATRSIIQHSDEPKSTIYSYFVYPIRFREPNYLVDALRLQLDPQPAMRCNATLALQK
jgi:hypothetical protein